MSRVSFSGDFWLVLALWLLLFPIQWTAGVLLAAAVHELGHIAMIRFTGGRIHSLELSASGARILTAPMTDGQELLCALSGPFAGACTILLRNIFPQMALAGLIQTLYNLLPLYPLDGGRALACIRNICCKRRDFAVQCSEYQKQTR